MYNNNDHELRELLNQQNEENIDFIIKVLLEILRQNKTYNSEKIMNEQSITILQNSKVDRIIFIIRQIFKEYKKIIKNIINQNINYKFPVDNELYILLSTGNIEQLTIIQDVINMSASKYVYNFNQYAGKKPSPKKPASKKPVAKKPSSKKPVAKKPSSKKPVSKKSVAKK
jgi:hypothetical protein